MYGIVVLVVVVCESVSVECGKKKTNTVVYLV